MSDWPAGTGRHHFEQIDSTNAEALRMAALGTPLPFWLTAGTQTAGRGRRGRAWMPGGGNFYGSIALDPGGDAGTAALRSFAAAMALAEALESLGVRPQDLALKWPNDVLLRGRKLAGILLETTSFRGRMVLVTGIGVNLASAPPASVLEPHAVPPISLSDTGLSVSANHLLDALAPAFHRWDQSLRTQGFAPLRAAWLARAARLGEVITARLPAEEITGTFETVDPTGAIVLVTGNGRRSLPAAEIHFQEGP